MFISGRIAYLCQRRSEWYSLESFTGSDLASLSVGTVPSKWDERSRQVKLDERSRFPSAAPKVPKKVERLRDAVKLVERYYAMLVGRTAFGFAARRRWATSDPGFESKNRKENVWLVDLHWGIF